MPSYHEGLPIALLEAMSYNLNVLVSNIPANLEVALDNKHYFEVGNIEALSKGILNTLDFSDKSIDNSKLIRNTYNWDIIAKKTIVLYKSMIS